MYYESIMHESRLVVSANAAANLIKNYKDESGELMSFHAIKWNANGRQLCAVADGGLNNPWLEVAVLDLSTMTQIESITAGWIDTVDELTKYFSECETGTFSMGKVKALPIDGEGENAPAYFTCGCCGDWFQSTVKIQRKYDQDEGYGMCRSCGR